MKNIIVPSIIAETQEELNIRIGKVRDYFSTMQIDIFDGLVVENRTFYFDFSLPEGIIFEADVYAKDPEQWIIEHGHKVRKILVHVEPVKDIMGLINLIRSKGKQSGLAINPETSLSVVRPFLQEIDQLLVMTVNPGKYGGEYLHENLEKVKEARNLAPKLDIEVDGGINKETIKGAKKAGANMFVSGSYLMNAISVMNAREELLKQLR